jgi:hypothetical protein
MGARLEALPVEVHLISNSRCHKDVVSFKVQADASKLVDAVEMRTRLRTGRSKVSFNCEGLVFLDIFAFQTFPLYATVQSAYRYTVPYR